MNGNKYFALRTAALALLTLDTAMAAAPTEIDSELKFHTYDEEARMRVDSTVGWLLLPLGSNHGIDLTVTHEAISGASPEYVTNQSGKPVQVLSSASIVERRDSVKLKYNHYRGEHTFSLGAVTSKEDDYESRGASLGYQREWKAQGTTLNFGVGANDDDVMSSRDPMLQELRKTHEYLIGVTQVLNRVTVVQSNISYITGEGYFSDPYKFTISVNGGTTSVYLDTRPPEHKQLVWLTGLRHHLPSTGATLITSYRYYQDDWGVIAHSVEFGWHQALGRFSVRPSLRYYTQRQADFYAHSLPAVPRAKDGAISTDHRLAGYGAINAGLRLAYAFNPRVQMSGSIEYYTQDPDLKMGPGGSSFDDLQATIFSIGINAKF